MSEAEYLFFPSLIRRSSKNRLFRRKEGFRLPNLFSLALPPQQSIKADPGLKTSRVEMVDSFRFDGHGNERTGESSCRESHVKNPPHSFLNLLLFSPSRSSHSLVGPAQRCSFRRDIWALRLFQPSVTSEGAMLSMRASQRGERMSIAL